MTGCSGVHSPVASKTSKTSKTQTSPSPVPDGETDGLLPLTPIEKIKPRKPKSSLQLFALMCGWYSTSCLSVFLSRTALLELDSAISFTLAVQVFSLFFGYVVIAIFSSNDFVVLSRAQFFDLVLPLGISMSGISLFYNTAMLFIQPSFLNTLKSTIPLWTCLICRFYLKQQFSVLTYISLVALLAGIVIAVFSEANFYLFGFIFAILSAWSNTVFNILAGRTMRRLSHLVTLWYTSLCSSLTVGIMWLVTNSSSMSLLSWQHIFEADRWLVSLIILSGLVYYSEMVLAYVLISSVSSLTYAISDVVRRLVIIVVSVLMFQNSIPPANAFGITVVLLGALIYNVSRNEYALETMDSFFTRCTRSLLWRKPKLEERKVTIV